MIRLQHFDKEKLNKSTLKANVDTVIAHNNVLDSNCYTNCVLEHLSCFTISSVACVYIYIYMGKNLLSVPESVTSAIKDKRANMH